MSASIMKSTWPIQQPLQQFWGLWIGAREADGHSCRRGQHGAVGNSWNGMVLYLSESTASDNPVSEDAFMDSLFLKVSFFVF